VAVSALSKRDAIRRAALDVFLQHGYTATSIDMILDAAGVSRQTLYNHFDGKEELFLAVIGTVLDELLGGLAERVDEVAIGDTEDLAGDLIGLGVTWVGFMLQPDFLALRRLVIGEAANFPQLARVWQERGPRRLEDRLLRAFGRLAGRGLLDLDDPIVTVELFAHSVTMLPGHFAMLQADLAPDKEKIDRYVTAAVLMFLARYGK